MELISEMFKICMVSIDVEEDLRSDNKKTFLGVENLKGFYEGVVGS